VFKKAICVHNSYSKTEDNNVHKVVMSTEFKSITLYYTCANGVSILFVIFCTVHSHHTENDFSYFSKGYHSS
jgi:hypothetical protein